MTVIGQDLINRSYQYARLEQFRKQGITHYRTVRGSTYHCPLCDEMAKLIWPVEEVVLPYHPRCVCIPVRVYKEREEEYKRLLADPNYKNVKYNPANGGLRADHIYHNFDKRGGVYEKHVQDAGYKSDQRKNRVD